MYNEKPSKNIYDMNEASLHISFLNESTHLTNIDKRVRCTGANRDKQKQVLCSDGLTNTLSENIIYNSNNPIEKRVTSRATLGMMRSEYLHKDRITRDIFQDAMSAQTIFESTCLKLTGSVKGYLQSIALSPFGFLLLCEIQV